jgi:hypothetical protein
MWCGKWPGRMGKHMMFCSRPCEAKYWKAVVEDYEAERDCPYCDAPLFGLQPKDCACRANSR